MPANPARTVTDRGPIDFNPSPKQRFRSTVGNITAHRALMELEGFDRALDFAQLQYQRKLAAAATDNNVALANGWKMTGVEEFIRELRTISEQAPIPTAVFNDNLDSNI